MTAFLVVYYLYDDSLVAAIFAGAAFSATSVGVTTAVWRDAGALNKPSGALLVDVAELDDISAIVMIGVLFALAPLLDTEARAPLASLIAREAGLAVLKLLLFAIACIIFSRVFEKKLTMHFARLDPQYGATFLAAGAAFALSAMADFMGLSVAIGAMFAGLTFSRDPAERTIDQSFAPIYDMFAPFFFVGIGMSVDISTLAGAAGMALVLFAAAILGKLVGVGAPALRFVPARGALLLGASMIPRAEVALLVMGYGLGLGPSVISQELYNAVVLTSLASCIASPIIVRRLLQTRPSSQEEALS
ncbi:MAG: cation:proton antiporter [Amphiplicatus sp.]